MSNCNTSAVLALEEVCFFVLGVAKDMSNCNTSVLEEVSYDCFAYSRFRNVTIGPYCM